MNLVRTSILNAIATLVRILTAIGLNKVLAVYVGPAGYALVGQFSNAIAMSGAVAGGALSSGVTQATASHADQAQRQRAVWHAAGRLTFAATCLTSLVIAFFAGPIAQRLVGSSTYRPTVLLLALVLPLMAANTLVLAVLNGKKEVRVYVLQNIAASLAGAVLSAALAMAYGVSGALAALVLNQSVALFVTLWLCRGMDWLMLSSFTGRPDRQAYRAMLGFAAMSLTGAIAAPLSQIVVRDHLIRSFGETAAGEWQAVFKISEIYLMFFTATLSVYYLPRLAELRDGEQLWTEIRRVYRLLLPLSALAAGAIWLLRQQVTTMLFSEHFVGMLDLFAWQLVGDVLKIGSWVLGYVMVGRAMVRWFIGTEIAFSASWVFLSMALTGVVGVQGVVLAFACNYGLYWLFMMWLIRRHVASSVQ